MTSESTAAVKAAPTMIEGPADRILEITRVFDAPRKLVFAAWTDPKHRTKWWGPKGWVLTWSRFDDIVGGCYRVCMQGPEGRVGWQRGVFREIEADPRLVNTVGWENEHGLLFNDTLVTVDFSDTANGRTLMVFRQGVFMTPEFRDGHEGGWTSSFERLTALLAGGDPS